jgi:hypothetical protein
MTLGFSPCTFVSRSDNRIFNNVMTRSKITVLTSQRTLVQLYLANSILLRL